MEKMREDFYRLLTARSHKMVVRKNTKGVPLKLWTRISPLPVNPDLKGIKRFTFRASVRFEALGGRTSQGATNVLYYL